MCSPKPHLAHRHNSTACQTRCGLAGPEDGSRGGEQGRAETCTPNEARGAGCHAFRRPTRPAEALMIVNSASMPAAGPGTAAYGAPPQRLPQAPSLPCSSCIPIHIRCMQGRDQRSLRLLHAVPATTPVAAAQHRSSPLRSSPGLRVAFLNWWLAR